MSNQHSPLAGLGAIGGLLAGVAAIIGTMVTLGVFDDEREADRPTTASQAQERPATTIGEQSEGSDLDAGSQAGQRYSADVRELFLAECAVDGVTRSDCDSILRCVEGQLSESEYVRLDAAARLGDTTEAAEVVFGCLSDFFG